MSRAILTYHSLDDSGSPISLAPTAFERHLSFFEKERIPVGSMREFPADGLRLTFDDGFSNFAVEGWPRLRDRGLRATLYVVAGRVGTNNDWGGKPSPTIPSLPLLDWDELAGMAEEGLDLGCHSMTHPDMRGLSADALLEETEDAARLIEKHTGYRPRSFCYPFGHVDETCRDAVAGSFETAVTTEFATLRDEEDQHLLPRVDAYYFARPGPLESFGRPGFERFVKRRRFLRRIRRFIGPGSLV